jgi:chemotaxis protein CheD
MSKTTDTLVPVNYFLEPGYIYLAEKPTAISTVLGSSVSICLYDGKRRIGGINHYRYPFTRDRKNSTAYYGNVAIITLIRMLCEDGSKMKHLKAQLFGGAHNSRISSRDIGSENVRVAKKILDSKKVPVISEDVGGQVGRKVVFRTDINEIIVIKVENLRSGDWFPYDNTR